MKKITFFKQAILLSLSLIFVLTACRQEGKQEVLLNEDTIPPAHLERLEAMNFDLKDIGIEEVALPTGTTEKSYVLEGDMKVPIKQMESFLENEIVKSAQGEQRRLTSIVNAPRTIKVLGYTGGGLALSNKMRTALSWAVNNYNSLNLELTFVLIYGGADRIAEADIVVYKSMLNSSAGLPSNGNPYKWVRINAGVDAFTFNYVEGLMTHNIGHCIGVVHTDGNAGYIAPGTPALDPNSIFNENIPFNTNGEFSFFDRVLLREMY